MGVAYVIHLHVYIITIVIRACNLWGGGGVGGGRGERGGTGSQQEVSRHPDPGPASQVVPRCNPSSLFLPPDRGVRCYACVNREAMAGVNVWRGEFLQMGLCAERGCFTAIADWLVSKGFT